MAKVLTRRTIVRLGLAAPLAASLGALPSAASAAPEAGPYEVGVVDRMDLVDKDRSRTIPTRAYFPTKPGRYPVIIFSHGFGGSLVAFANNSRVWASHGYVVLHPTHADSIGVPDPSAPAAEAATIRAYLQSRGAIDPALNAAFVKVLDNPFYLTSRLADVAFLQRALRRPADGLDPAVLQRADMMRTGMSGHSFGAYTTLAIGGAKVSPPLPITMPTGFLGVMPISGQGPGRMGLNDGSFSGMTLPMMAITGTRDFGAAGETPPWRLKPYDLSPAGRKFAVVVDGFTHRDFDPAPDDPTHGERGAALRRLELAFWRGTLGDDEQVWGELAQIASRSSAADPVWLRQR